MYASMSPDFKGISVHAKVACVLQSFCLQVTLLGPDDGLLNGNA
jgi:hypothetical protein